MSSTNLFGQYYNNLGKNKTYQGINYNCSSATSGENSIIFSDGEVQLVDSNGNVITRLDLSQINAGPINSYTSGNIVLNPGEVKLIEGIEYGKLYKNVYFEVPNIYVSSLGDSWKYLINVKFTILLNVDLDLREYEVSTTVSSDDKKSIVDRIQKLIDEIGSQDNIEVSIEEIEDEYGVEKTYIVFKSLVLGYDFIITDFKFFNHRIIKSDTSDLIEASDEISDENLESITEAEDNITFHDGTSFDGITSEEDTSTNVTMNLVDVGRYDGEDVPSDPNSASHYYETTVDEYPQENQDDNLNESEEPQQDPDENHEDDDQGDIPEPEEQGEEDDDTIIVSMEFPVDGDKTLEIPAFKYPNGAARVWFVVPTWPESVDKDYVSLKLNHVRDKVIIPEVVTEGECAGLCSLEERYVYAAERNEIERHNMKDFKYWLGDNFTYMDSDNGSVVEVNHSENMCQCPDLKLEIMNPHIGMYRYLDYVTMNDMWINVGDFYGLITNADTDDVDIKNLANSMFLYNKNIFPVKVSYFICS